MESEFTKVTYLRIESYSQHPEVYAFAEELVDDYMADKQRIRDRAEFIRTARKLIASLWLRENDLFRFTTKAANFGSKRKQVWMSRKTLILFTHLLGMKPTMIRLVEQGIHSAVSKSGKGFSAVYCCTSDFKSRLSSLQVEDIIPDPNLPLIELRDSERNLMEIDSDIRESEWFNWNLLALEQHHRLLRSAEILDREGKPLPSASYRYVRKFKHDFSHGGRLYADFTNLPKRERLSITFSGEEAASLDLSQLHPTMIMQMLLSTDSEPVGMLRGPLEDAYDMPQYNHLPRAVHKKLINALFNAETEEAAVRSIKTAHLALTEDGWKCNTYKGRQKRIGTKIFPDNEKGARKYLEYFKFIHPHYKRAICSGVGAKLQRLDSDMAMKVLHYATNLGVPCLPVHDEFVFPASLELIVRRCIGLAFEEVMERYKPTGEVRLSLTDSNFNEYKLVIPLHKTLDAYTD